jgi:hypothetical protein
MSLTLGQDTAVVSYQSFKPVGPCQTGCPLSIARSLSYTETV